MRPMDRKCCEQELKFFWYDIKVTNGAQNRCMYSGHFNFRYIFFFVFVPKLIRDFVQLQIVMGNVSVGVCTDEEKWQQHHEWMLDIGHISHFECENAFTLTIEHVCHFLLKRICNLFNLNYNFVLNDSWPFTSECGGRKRDKNVWFLNSWKWKWNKVLSKPTKMKRKPKKDRPFLNCWKTQLSSEWYLLVL